MVYFIMDMSEAGGKPFPSASFCCLFIPGEELLMEGRLIIVTAPNEAGRSFVKLLIYKKLAFAVLTNSAQEERQLKKWVWSTLSASIPCKRENGIFQKRNW